jgi:hypothetical protein
LHGEGYNLKAYSVASSQQKERTAWREANLLLEGIASSMPGTPAGRHCFVKALIFQKPRQRYLKIKPQNARMTRIKMGFVDPHDPRNPRNPRNPWLKT